MGRLCVAAVLMARGNERARYGRLRLGCSLAIHVGEHRDDDQQHHDHVVATDQRRHGTSDTPTEHRAELRDVSAVAHSLDAREERDDVAHNQSDDQRHAGTHQDAQEEDGVVGEGEAVEIDRAADGTDGHRIGDRRIVYRSRAERKTSGDQRHQYDADGGDHDRRDAQTAYRLRMKRILSSILSAGCTPRRATSTEQYHGGARRWRNLE